MAQFRHPERRPIRKLTFMPKQRGRAGIAFSCIVRRGVLLFPLSLTPCPMPPTRARSHPSSRSHNSHSWSKRRPPVRTGAHELKYDGYRIHARLARGGARLLTRTGLGWTDRYEATANAISALAVLSAYLDGELCADRPDGTTSVSEIQAATDERRTCTSSLISYFSTARRSAGCPFSNERNA
jgi:hypothetical protein